MNDGPSRASCVAVNGRRRKTQADTDEELAGEMGKGGDWAACGPVDSASTLTPPAHYTCSAG